MQRCLAGLRCASLRVAAALGFFVVTFGQVSESQEPPARVLDSGALRSVCLDLMGRPPYLAERNRWLGKPLFEYVDYCLAEEEFWTTWVEEQFYYYLLIDNFRPRAERVLNLPKQMHAGSKGVLGALHGIALCASFDRRNPGPDTFVTVMMEQFLGLKVQSKTSELEAGKRLYDGRAGSFIGIPGRSQSDVIRIVLQDRRALTHYLQREHQRILREPASKGELRSWAQAMAKGQQTYAQILRTWLISDAYGRRLGKREQMTNRVFVQSLFVDLSDAKPEPAEARRLRNALDGLSTAGPLRAVIARLYIDSGRVDFGTRSKILDPSAWVSELFDRLLGRQATPEELSSLVSAFHDPACRPATLVYAMVSHPEYQIW